MNRIRLMLTAAAGLLLATTASAQVVKAPTKALRTTATAAASRAADKVAARVATTEAAGQASTKPATTPAKPAATPTPEKPAAKSTTKPGKAAAAAAATAATAATTNATGPAVDTTRGAKGTSVSKRGAATEMVFNREVYAYPGQGRRDPFASLLKSGDLRPLISDLRLVTVIYDATGRNSVAIMRDVTTKDQYRVKNGQTLGRMRVAGIQPRHVVFTIDEFGYNRQETLSLSDTTSARNP